MSDVTTTAKNFAKTTLALYALVKDAEELAAMASPTAPRLLNANGVSDPTVSAVMDSKREAVADALREINKLTRATHPQLTDLITAYERATETLRAAVAAWQS